MSDIFNSLNDDIFLQDTNNKDVALDYSKINEITKKYMHSNASTSEKKFFLILRKNYLKIKSIDNYQELQKIKYKDKDRDDIISFEISRIKKNIACNDSVLLQLDSIEKLISLIEDVKNIDYLYNKIINSIIKIELLLGMKVGLLNELCCLFESTLNDIENDLNANHIRKRINGE